MSTGDNAKSILTRDQILEALQALSDELGSRGITGEICLFGGTAMVLAFTARLATRDVDAIFQPAGPVREIARSIAVRQNLPIDWLNDAVKGFVSSRHETTEWGLPQYPNLRVIMPVPEYLLAMKCIAARIGGTGDEPSDIADLRVLIDHLRFRSAAEVLDLVARYYPPNQIPPRTQYLIESLFEEGRL